MVNYIKSLLTYWGYTHSVFLILKMIFIAFLSLINNLTFLKFNSIYLKIFASIKGNYIFKTGFGAFVATSPTEWIILSPNYESHIDKIILNNYNKYKNFKNRVFISVGSHIGRYPILLSKKYGYNSFAFEPVQETYNKLVANIYLSNIQGKVCPNNFALGNINRTGHIYINEFGNGSNSLVFKPKNEIKQKIEIRKFDDLNLKIQPKDIKLMIIDAEGYELNILKGMKNALGKMGDVNIIIEIHSNVAADVNNKEEVFKFMNQFEFKATKIGDIDYLFRK